MKYQDLDISTQIILKVIFAGLVLWVLWSVREIILLLLLALVLASAMEPLVDYFYAKKVPRALSLALVYVIVLGLAALVIYLMIPPVVSQFKILVDNFPEYVQALESQFGPGVRNFLQNFGSNFSGGNVVEGTVGAFSGALDFLAVLVISFYLVAEEKGMKRFVAQLIPSRHQDFSLSLVDKIQRKMGLWVLGQFISSLFIFVLTYAGLSLLHVPYALVLALVAALFEIVPYIGPILASVPAIFIGFIQDPTLAIWVALLYFLVHEFEGYVLVPQVMQKTTGISPLLVLVALMVGYQLAGAIGLIISVPLATALTVVVKEIWPNEKGQNV